MVQFYDWKAHALETAELKGASIDVIPLSKFQREKINCLKAVALKDVRLANTIFGQSSGKSLQRLVDGFRFSALVSEWEAYTIRLRKEVIKSLPQWRTHQSVFSPLNLD